MKTRFEWIFRPCRIGACVILLAPAIAGADEGRAGNGNGGPGSSAPGGGANQNSAAAGSSSTNGTSAAGTSVGGTPVGGGSLDDKSRGRDTWSDKADNRDGARCEASQFLCTRSANGRHAGSNGYETADGSLSPVGAPMNLLPVHFHGTFHPVNQGSPIPLLKGGKAIARPVVRDPQVANSEIRA